MTILIDLVPEAGQEAPVPEHPLDSTIDLKAEEDSPTRAPAAVTETVATVGVPHKTATTEGPQDEAGTAQHHLDTRSATSLHPQICPR